MNKKNRVIIHIDVDSFFVSCEVALRPELANKEVAISLNNDNSVVISLSYAAKNKGAKVPQKLYLVKKYCKNLIIINPNKNLYQYYSKKIYNLLFNNYSNSIQIVSIDEWYIDVTDIWQKYNSIKNLAHHIQTKIFNELSMPVSLGISFNKFLAKMATAINKPMGITIITRKNFKDKIWPMPITNYYGIGEKTSYQLINLDILTIQDLAKQDINNKNIRKIFLNKTKKIINNANGIGDNDITTKNNSLSSLGNEKMFMNGFSNDSKEIYINFRLLCDAVSKKLVERNLSTRNIAINIKIENQKKSKSISLDKFISSSKDIFFYVSKLMSNLWKEEPLIGIGIIVSKLGNSFQNMVSHSLFEPDPKLSKTESIIENINSKMNKKVVMLGKEFEQYKKPGQNKLL